jgi:hypothetical protein
VNWCRNVTDAGIRSAICNCTHLCVLNLRGLHCITGMCGLCKDPELTLCFITVCFLLFLQLFTTYHKSLPLDHIVSRYISALIFIIFYLILHCVACYSHTPSPLPTSVTICAVSGCVSLSQFCMFFFALSTTFQKQNLIQNSFIETFVDHFQHLPAFSFFCT